MIDRKAILIATLAACLVAFTLLGYRFYSDREETALIGGHYELNDLQGASVKDTDFRGRYQMIYFGYTSCPDICPLTLQAMGDALTQMGAKAKEIQPIFISVDPEHDTPAVLKDYMANFYPGFLALTGDKEKIRAVAAAFRVYYAPAKEAGLIDHSSVIYVLDKNGRYLTHFSPDAKAQDILQELNRIFSLS